MKIPHPLTGATSAAVIVAIISTACSPGGKTEATVVPADAGERVTSAASASSDSPSSEEEWVEDRLEAVQGIWGFTPEGVAWQNSYDFRQMRGQPAWFGSTGFSGWAGAGQAIPHSVLHELGHSYWGAFPVVGAPDGDVEWLLDSYGADLLTFMRQPPDRFEPLRDRFRNLPNLDRGNLTDLVHFGESELIYFTGGDLDLIPPILRKYYGSYLTDEGVAGEVGDWPVALGWWLELDDSERGDAGAVFGLQHFPLDDYAGLPRPPEATLDGEISAILDNEERQRLRDFAEQFEEIKSARSSLADATGTDRGFNFWERYLRDVSRLHIQHPEVLENRTGAGGRDLGLAFDAYQEMADLSPSEQADRYRSLIATDIGPNIRDLAPLLKARTLLILFPEGSDAATEGIEASAGAYAAEFRELVAIADDALSTAATDPVAAASGLATTLDEFSDDRLAGSVDTVFNTIRDADRDSAAEIIGNLPDPFLLRLLDVRPSAARVNEISPNRLLNTAGVLVGASDESLLAGIALLAENSSGNFAIDAPFDKAIYEFLDDLSYDRSDLVLRVFRETDLRPMPWVAGHGVAAARVFRSDPAAAVGLLAGYDGPEPTAARLLRRLAYSDPGTTANLIQTAIDLGQVDIATETLNSLVYDSYWADLGVERDARIRSTTSLLLSLRDQLGEVRTIQLVAAGVAGYLGHVEEGALEAEYRSRHLATFQKLESSATTDTDREYFRSLTSEIKAATP